MTLSVKNKEGGRKEVQRSAREVGSRRSGSKRGNRTKGSQWDRRGARGQRSKRYAPLCRPRLRTTKAAMSARQKRRKRSAESSCSLNSEAHRGKAEKRSEKARGEKRKGERQRGERCQKKDEARRKEEGERRRKAEKKVKMRGRRDGKAKERRMGGRKEKVAVGNTERQLGREVEGRKEREELRCSQMVVVVDRSMELALVVVTGWVSR